MSHRSHGGASVSTVDIHTGVGVSIMVTPIPITIIFMIPSIIPTIHLIITTVITVPIIIILIGQVIMTDITVITIRGIHTIMADMFPAGMYITEPEVQDHPIHIVPTVHVRQTHVQEV